MAEYTVQVALRVLRDMRQEEAKNLTKASDWPDFTRRRGRISSLEEAEKTILDRLSKGHESVLDEEDLEDV